MKRMLALLLSVCITIMLSSCFDDNPTNPKTKTSFWKQTDKEIWWQHRVASTIPGNVAWSPWEKIAAVPYGANYTVTYADDTYKYSLIGAEYNYTCTDSSYYFARKWTTNFAWDPLPANMTADTLYSIAAETKGDGGNMMLISNSYNFPGTSNDWILSANRNAGKILAKVKIPKPIDVTNPGKKAIRASIASTYALIEYTYIYEWVTE